jgi:hypothetical protein
MILIRHWPCAKTIEPSSSRPPLRGISTFNYYVTSIALTIVLLENN